MKKIKPFEIFTFCSKFAIDNPRDKYFSELIGNREIKKKGFLARFFTSKDTQIIDLQAENEILKIKYLELLRRFDRRNTSAMRQESAGTQMLNSNDPELQWKYDRLLKSYDGMVKAWERLFNGNSWDFPQDFNKAIPEFSTFSSENYPIRWTKLKEHYKDGRKMVLFGNNYLYSLYNKSLVIGCYNKKKSEWLAIDLNGGADKPYGGEPIWFLDIDNQTDKLAEGFGKAIGELK